MADYKQYSWGYELCYADTPLYSAHMLVIKENEKTPYVYYKNRDRTIFLLQGQIILHEEGKNRTLNEGESYTIPRNIMHRFISLKGDSTILEVGSKIEENDIVIVEK